MLYDGREDGLFDTEINNFEIIDDKLIVYGIYKMHEKIELIFHGYVDGDMLCVLGNHTFEYMEPTYDKDRDIWKYEIRMKGLCEYATVWASDYEIINLTFDEKKSANA